MLHLRGAAIQRSRKILLITITFMRKVLSIVAGLTEKRENNKKEDAF